MKFLTSINRSSAAGFQVWVKPKFYSNHEKKFFFCLRIVAVDVRVFNTAVKNKIVLAGSELYLLGLSNASVLR